MNKAFTLVELLAVILMIAILTSVALPYYTRAVRRAEMIEGLTNGRTILDAAVRYQSINSEWPTSFNQLDVGFINATDSGNPENTLSEFDDGNFIYSLHSGDGLKYVGVRSTKGGYTLKMLYPIVSSTGVSAPIMCCPDANSADGQWLCTNMAGDTGSFQPTDCREIK